ncbi:MAG: GTP-binding protein EngB [Candidatus Thorarchaeota archaeon]|jgi:GTP-binding protein EngB required for normal cell division
MKEPDSTGKSKNPMIVFAGRSNVGKSSTIRALTGKKVRVGKKPGSTRWELMIDFGPITIVDIPGFGYMSGQSKTMIEETKVNIVTKLESWSDRLALSVLIVDISLFRVLFERWSSRGEIPIDVEFYGFLSEISQHVIVLANKSDKVKIRNLSDELLFLKEQLRDVVPTIEPKVIVTSALKKQGFRELTDSIDNILREQGIEVPLWAFTASS